MSDTFPKARDRIMLDRDFQNACQSYAHGNGTSGAIAAAAIRALKLFPNPAQPAGPVQVKGDAISGPARMDHACVTCISLLAEASRLAKRAQDLDIDVAHARHVGKGCATPALAILKQYDADLERWQHGVTAHLKGHSFETGNFLHPTDLKGPTI
jgi:hypothetical protein